MTNPSPNSSQIPTFLLCRLARSKVKVALSGDGGDELFGGYYRYRWAPRVWRLLGKTPFALRKIAGRGVMGIPAAAWDRLGDAIGVDQTGNKAHKLGERLDRAHSFEELYTGLITDWPIKIMAGEPGENDDIELADTGDARCGKAKSVEWLMQQDLQGYLPDDLLCKIDRAAMSVSLEARAPFLDSDVIAAAARLPMDMKIRDNQGKWILRRIFEKYVPRNLFDRPEAGFAIPVGAWLKGPLKIGRTICCRTKTCARMATSMKPRYGQPGSNISTAGVTGPCACGRS